MRFKDGLQREIYYRGQIDYSYWLIQEISKHTGQMQSPLDAMIDKATGFDKDRVKSQIINVEYLCGVIIRCKSRLGYDTTNDKKFLKEVKLLKQD